jgi:Flp pilus assembly protein TadG
MKNRNRNGILTKIAGFMRDVRGISAVEFAFVFPVMAILYLGGTAATQAIVIKRKVTMATRVVGDLVAQEVNITDAEKTAILTAATSVINPYPAGSLSVIVSSVVIDASGNAKIDWSEATSTTTAHAKNMAVTLPTGIGGTAMAGKTIIWAEGSYAYTLPVGSAIMGMSSMTLSEQFYLRPRRVTQITRSAT